MPQLINANTDSYGLSGGTIVTGNTTQAADAYVFYPLTDCATVTIVGNYNNGPLTLSTALAGVPIYGAITSVTMSSGTAILYSGSYWNPR